MTALPKPQQGADRAVDRANPHTHAADPARMQSQTTLRDVVDLYLAHARGYYHTREAINLRATLGRLRRAYGDVPAGQFRALRLQAWRERLIAEGLSRGYINRACAHVRRCYKWAVSLELVEPDALESLRAVDGLKRGRCNAIERPPVEPVTPELVIATLPWLTPTVRDIIEVLRLTGARTGEIRLMRTADIDTSGVVWIYRPSVHKSAHHGRPRAIPIDEQCQEVILPHLTPFTPHRYIFESREGRPYAESSIRNAVAKACKRAGLPHWHPHQIRHRVLTEARAAGLGLDEIRALAGHAHISTSELYARADESKAVEAIQTLRRAGG